MRYLVLSSVILPVLTLLAAPPTYTISGQVQDNTGKAASGVRVCAIAEDFDANKPNVPIPCAFSDQQGKFAITVDKASKYQLIYDDSPNGHFSTYLAFFRPPSATLPEVWLGDDNVTTAVTISMSSKNGQIGRAHVCTPV